MPAVSKAQKVGLGVRSLRIRAGMTQTQLAAAANIADATLSRIERNRITPSVDLAKRLAAALRVSIDALFQVAPNDQRQAFRPSEARLLAVVRDLDDAQVDDVVRGLKLIFAVGRAAQRRR
jgi:DNA-binding XRE family transcriptional regulator